MTKAQRHEERFAQEVLRRVLNITVTDVDDNSVERMSDALFVLPDGTEGALEVTTIGDRAALEIDALAAKGPWVVNGAQWSWMIHVGAAVSMRELGNHLSDLVLTCERLGATRPELIRDEVRDRPAFRWLESCDARLDGFPGSNRRGCIEVVRGGDGGAVSDHLNEFPAWLRNRLREPDLSDKIDKLRSTGRFELHLFLRVHDNAMPFALYDPLAFGEAMPTAPLDPPGDLKGVWLAPAWRNPILWWGSTKGWNRVDCLD